MLEFLGILDQECIKHALMAYFSSPQRDLLTHHIIDISKVHKFSLSFNTLLEIIQLKVTMLEQFPQSNAVCVIYCPNETGYGMARMYQQLCEGSYPFGINIARDWSEALRVVGFESQPELSEMS